ncbi:MAG: TonB-dependent receptor [Acidobacteria bacterium]|nr:TonB-dependent receptor [Acidobacteriota bacterium]MCW5969918.1 TonB-dependent receptor [Blastocatellales bacterium]
MKKCFVVIALLAGLVAPTQAQPAASMLSGRVTDPAGAVIVGARVKATNTATAAARETTTNGEGLYAFANLAPGEYEVEIRQDGFRMLRVLGLVLGVGQVVNRDFALEVGQISDGHEDLVSPAPLVNLNSAVIDGVITPRAIGNLPLNGRNFLELALLVPGNAPAPNFDPTKSNSVLISSAGQLGRGGNVTIDGTDNNDDAVGGPLLNVTQEAVQEFQIATSRFSAELGRSASSVINVVTKSGTNELHGSGSFFFRDDALQGLPATFDSANPKPSFDRQQYAFGVGGPVVKDRAFWFGAFEYRNQDGAVLVGERNVAARTITRTFAAAPLRDVLGTGRFDWLVSNSNQLSIRYSGEKAEDTGASTLERPIGSASQRQQSRNRYNSVLANLTSTASNSAVNSFSFSFNRFRNDTAPLSSGPQLTFPSLQDGVSFRVPQGTTINRIQFSDVFSKLAGAHALRFGGEVQRVDAEFNLGVFQQGRIELVQDFAGFDHNGDGRIDDGDLLFAVTLRSATPARALDLPDSDNTHLAFFFQDDWRVRPQLTLNLGLRYELDTDVKNVSRYNEINPILRPFLRGDRKRDRNNFGPRFGFNWATRDGRFSLHGGYGIYYDRVVLQIQSLERGLDGRALAIEVRAGNALSDPTGAPIFIDPATGRFRPGAPTLASPFTGFVLPGAGATGLNIIDNDLQNPMIQQTNFGLQWEFARDYVLRADYLHGFGTHFILGRTIATIFSPSVGGPDRVVNLESSAKTKYDAMLLGLERRFARGSQFRVSYTLSKAFNFANDDQIPFLNGPVDPRNIGLEYGPTPNDQRHRFTFSGVFEMPLGLRLSPIWTMASGVPMDILLPDASSRIPVLQRNAGGRLFKTGADLNLFINEINSRGGINGAPLPTVSDEARFNDGFNSFDLRLSRAVRLNERLSIEPIAEVFNLFNMTNILGVSNVNYSGFTNALTRDDPNPTSPGYLRSSGFGRAVTTAGGVFGTGGPRAFQFAVRVAF